jgi:hypothetical protein
MLGQAIYLFSGFTQPGYPVSNGNEYVSGELSP